MIASKETKNNHHFCEILNVIVKKNKCDLFTQLLTPTPIPDNRLKDITKDYLTKEKKIFFFPFEPFIGLDLKAG